MLSNPCGGQKSPSRRGSQRQHLRARPKSASAGNTPSTAVFQHVPVACYRRHSCTQIRSYCWYSSNMPWDFLREPVGKRAFAHEFYRMNPMRASFDRNFRDGSAQDRAQAHSRSPFHHSFDWRGSRKQTKQLYGRTISCGALHERPSWHPCIAGDCASTDSLPKLRGEFHAGAAPRLRVVRCFLSALRLPATAGKTPHQEGSATTNEHGRATHSC